MARVDASHVRAQFPFRSRDVRANGIRLHTIGNAGPDHGELVIFIHGIGEYWWSFHRQLTYFGDKGFSAVAVDLRGCGDSDKPPRGYDSGTLAADIHGLITALGYNFAHVVGINDGGLVGWVLASKYPEQVRSLVLIGSPHPLALQRVLFRHPWENLILLRFVLFAQLPFVPERFFVKGDRLRAALSGFSSGADSENWVDDSVHFEQAFRIHPVAHLTLERQRWLFRSLFRFDGRRFRRQLHSKIHCPVLVFHGERDRLISRRSIRKSARWVNDFHYLEVPHSGHYAHIDNPDFVNAKIAQFYSELAE